MSSEALVEGPNGVVAAWETQGQVKFGRVDSRSGKIGAITAAPGAGRDRKHPVLAVNSAGQTLLTWTEGTGWNRGGALAWQLYDAAYQPLPAKGRTAGAVPAWGLVAAAARPDGSFVILY